MLVTTKLGTGKTLGNNVIKMAQVWRSNLASNDKIVRQEEFDKRKNFDG